MVDSLIKKDLDELLFIWVPGKLGKARALASSWNSFISFELLVLLPNISDSCDRKASIFIKASS